LVSLKQSIDEGVRSESDRYRLVEEAQVFLIDREIRLTNTRKNAIESSSAKSLEVARNNVALATQFTHHGVQYNNNAGKTRFHSMGIISLVYVLFSISEQLIQYRPTNFYCLYFVNSDTHNSKLVSIQISPNLKLFLTH
jgi:hypothetical protein